MTGLSSLRRGAGRASVLVVLMALLSVPGLTVRADAQVGEAVGTMIEVIREVTGTPPGGSPAAIAVGDGVVLNTVLESGRAAGARMTLEPAGSLQLGPEARLVVDRNTVDAATGATESGLSLLLGKIRLALSSAFRGEVEIDTPTATIGIKGTVLTVDVAPSGDTVVWVTEGVVEVQSKAGGEAVTVSAGELSTVASGLPATGPTPFDPATGVAAVRVLPPIFNPPGEDALDDSPTFTEGEQLPPGRDVPPPTGVTVRQSEPQRPPDPPAPSNKPNG
ncbi:MAG: FecR family protein [Acidobacteriota bacterium]